MMIFDTMSTGIRSARLSPWPCTQLIMPMPPPREMPPAADIVSVHPGTGSFQDPEMIEGRIKRTGRSGLLLF